MSLDEPCVALIRQGSCGKPRRRTEYALIVPWLGLDEARWQSGQGPAGNQDKALLAIRIKPRWQSGLSPAGNQD